MAEGVRGLPDLGVQPQPIRYGQAGLGSGPGADPARQLPPKPTPPQLGCSLLLPRDPVCWKKVAPKRAQDLQKRLRPAQVGPSLSCFTDEELRRPTEPLTQCTLTPRLLGVPPLGPHKVGLGLGAHGLFPLTLAQWVSDYWCPAGGGRTPQALATDMALPPPAPLDSGRGVLVSASAGVPLPQAGVSVPSCWCPLPDPAALSFWASTLGRDGRLHGLGSPAGRDLISLQSSQSLPDKNQAPGSPRSGPPPPVAAPGDLSHAQTSAPPSAYPHSSAVSSTPAPRTPGALPAPYRLPSSSEAAGPCFLGR